MNYITQPLRAQHVVIIGGGFSGTLQAINLLRHGGVRITLIERAPEIGCGVAYSAAHPNHLLNVRAGNMSALPDDPDHFLRWLAGTHPDLSGFVPRAIYGDYLSALLNDACARSEGRLTLVSGNATAVHFGKGGAMVSLAEGPVIVADVVILALGNLPPKDPPAIASAKLDKNFYVADPWAGKVTQDLAGTDKILIIGSGLTMVDVALLLEAEGFSGEIFAISRRGLMPRSHIDGALGGLHLDGRPPPSPTALLRFVRKRATRVGWRSAVDELRPHTQDLWLAADTKDRARFLRHLRPWWDVHRHRLAPEVAARVAAMQRSGKLNILAGKVSEFEHIEDGVRITWRARGQDLHETMMVRRIINCSGPQGDLACTDEPLLRHLLDSGMARPDGLRLGIDVTTHAEVIDAQGNANPRLFMLGPMTRGVFWEIVAVPDIRVQTWAVAHRLCVGA